MLLPYLPKTTDIELQLWQVSEADANFAKGDILREYVSDRGSTWHRLDGSEIPLAQASAASLVLHGGSTTQSASGSIGGLIEYQLADGDDWQIGYITLSESGELIVKDSQGNGISPAKTRIDSGDTTPPTAEAVEGESAIASTIATHYFSPAVWGIAADFTVSGTAQAINVVQGDRNPSFEQSFQVGDRVILTEVSAAGLRVAQVILNITAVGTNQVTVERQSGAANGTVFTSALAELTGQTRLPAAPAGETITEIQISASLPSALHESALDSDAADYQSALALLSGIGAPAYFAVKTSPDDADIDFNERIGITLREGSLISFAASDRANLRLVSGTIRKFTPLLEVSYLG